MQAYMHEVYRAYRENHRLPGRTITCAQNETAFSLEEPSSHPQYYIAAVTWHHTMLHPSSYPQYYIPAVKPPCHTPVACAGGGGGGGGEGGEGPRLRSVRLYR